MTRVRSFATFAIAMGASAACLFAFKGMALLCRAIGGAQ